MRRWIAGTVALVALFLGLLFPTDAVVRWVLPRVLPPGPSLTFEHATLRPSGITLDTVTVRSAEGGMLLSAGRVTVQPTWSALLGDGAGRPLTIAVDACGGHATALVDGERQAATVSVEWRAVDLAACPRLRVAGGVLEAGLVDGDAHLTLASDSPDGTGTLTLRDAVWQGVGRLTIFGPLHVATGSARWRLAGGQLHIEDVDLKGPEVLATGSGTVTLADPTTASALDLALAVTPAPDAPGRIRVLFRLSGDATTTKHLAIGGTLGAPNARLELE